MMHAKLVTAVLSLCLVGVSCTDIAPNASPMGKQLCGDTDGPLDAVTATLHTPVILYVETIHGFDTCYVDFAAESILRELQARTPQNVTLVLWPDNRFDPNGAPRLWSGQDIPNAMHIVCHRLRMRPGTPYPQGFGTGMAVCGEMASRTSAEIVIIVNGAKPLSRESASILQSTARKTTVSVVVYGAQAHQFVRLVSGNAVSVLPGTVETHSGPVHD